MRVKIINSPVYNLELNEKEYKHIVELLKANSNGSVGASSFERYSLELQKQILKVV